MGLVISLACVTGTCVVFHPLLIQLVLVITGLGRYILPSLHVRADASTTYGPFSVGLPLLDSIWHEQVRVGLTLSMRVISLKVTCQNVALPSAGIALVNTYIPQVRECARVSACVCVCVCGSSSAHDSIAPVSAVYLGAPP